MKEYIAIDRLHRLRSVSIFNISYPAGYKAQLKKGTPADTIVIVLLGRINVKVADGSEFILTSDQIACFPRGYERESEYIEDTHLISIHLDFEVSEFAEFARLLPVSSLDQFQKTCLDKLKKAASGEKAGELTVAACLYGLLDHLVAPDAVISAEASAVIAAKLMIENEFIKNRQMSVYAKMAHMSESTFRRYFIRYVGQPPARFRQMLRLDYAKHLIISGECSIDEASRRAGFCSLQYFCRQCRLYFGCPPGRLAKNEK